MSEDLHERNKNRIKKFLLNFLSCTKKDVADGVEMNLSLVGKIIDEMQKNGEVVQAGQDISRGGWLINRYRLNEDSSYAMIICLTMKTVKIQVINLFKKVREEQTFEVAGEKHIDCLNNAILDVKSRYPALRNIAMSVPGNVQDGKIMYVSQPNYLVGTDIAQILSQKCELPVFTFNDANVMALGYYTKHIEISLKNNSMVYLCCTEAGPGAGVIVDSKIVNGFSGFAGEISAIWPRQENETLQIQNYISAIISVINPRYLVLSPQTNTKIDEDAIKEFVCENFPEHSIPELRFSSETEINLTDGLAALAFANLFPNRFLLNW